MRARPTRRARRGDGRDKGGGWTGELVCLDECTKQLTREVRTPVAAAPGQPAREDYEYERNGVAAIFCAVAPHLGWRHIEERERKTRVDYAHFLRALCDDLFRGAEKIVLVQDNLNTHSPASLYEAFPPAEAARIRARFEFHFTPKHGSWLNIAEIELSALARGCLARRIPDRLCGVAQAPRSRANSTRGSVTATSPRAPSAGSSPPPPHAPNSASSTQHLRTDTALG